MNPVTGKDSPTGPASFIRAHQLWSTRSTFMSQGGNRRPPLDRRHPSSTQPNHYGPLPYPAVRLIIGQHFDEDPETGSWALFIAAAFYDSQNRRLWQTEILLGQFRYLDQSGRSHWLGQHPVTLPHQTSVTRESPSCARHESPVYCDWQPRTVRPYFTLIYNSH